MDHILEVTWSVPIDADARQREALQDGAHRRIGADLMNWLRDGGGPVEVDYRGVEQAAPPYPERNPRLQTYKLTVRVRRPR